LSGVGARRSVGVLAGLIRVVIVVRIVVVRRIRRSRGILLSRAVVVVAVVGPARVVGVGARGLSAPRCARHRQSAGASFDVS
jgi:hypothetical protein